jgi:hypothetical protein
VTSLPKTVGKSASAAGAEMSAAARAAAAMQARFTPEWFPGKKRAKPLCHAKKVLRNRSVG